MTRSARLAITAAVIGLALGLAAGMPPWPDRTTMVTISLLLLASAAVAAMWAMLTIEPLEDAELDPALPAAPARARIHQLSIATDAAGTPALAYTAVADIATDSADDAFARSQNIDSSWTEGDGVNPYVDGSCRSTSVGDVIDITGRLLIVEPIGFAEVVSLAAAIERARATSFLAYLLPKSPVAQRQFVS